MIDKFTKYAKLYPLKRATCKATIRKVDEFIDSVGKPQKILTDRGTQFTCKKKTEPLVSKASRPYVNS